MKTQRFEAVLTFEKKTLPDRGLLFFQEKRVLADFHFYGPILEDKPGCIFALVTVRRPLDLKWNDSFEVVEGEKRGPIGRGEVLNPCAPKRSEAGKGTRKSFLLALAGGEKAMLDALCQENGIKGLRERDIQEFCSLSKAGLVRLSQKLEEEGKVKILSFWPLFLISQESFAFLVDKILDYVSRYHERHPEQKGAPLERIKRRFGLAENVLLLAARSLERAGKVRESGQRLTLPSHEAALSPEEEMILQQLEAMCFKGEFQSLSLEQVCARFRLPPERLERLLALLAERRKIIQGPEGLYIHAHWLEEIIGRVRNLGKKELTVADFKAVTGLSRKYAIPLLELLDEMGVTRRKGPLREIL